MSENNPPANGNGQDLSSQPLTLKDDFPAPSIEEWRKVVEKDLKGADFNKKLVWKTVEGIDVQPLYTREDLEGVEHRDNLPGFPPYTRGTQPLQGVNYPWQIRQDMMLAAPEDVNASVRDALARGQSAIGIRLDNAARQGYDGDSPEARELAGRGGCTMTSINGLRIALADIDLEKYPITIRTGTAALPILSMLVALADEEKIERRMLVGAVECDPIRELVKSGTLRGPLSLHYREMADMVKFCSENCPGIRPVMVNSTPYHNAGASAVQELGMTMAAAVEYFRAMTDRKVDPDTAALGMLFSFSVGTNVFFEIAKLRAARTLWAKITKALGVEREDGWKMFLHARTSTFTKTIHDPYNNMLRTTVEAFAGAVGGCDSMHAGPFTEIMGRPDEFGMRIARNQQLILQEEAYLNRVVDPSAGSYYIEKLTDSIGREAWKIFQEIEEMGGFVEALKKGVPQKMIEKVAAKKRELAAQRRTPIVGVSNYSNPQERLPEKRHIPREEFLAERRRRLNRLKSMRKNSELRTHLQALTQLVYTEEGNLMDSAVKVAAENATIGEMIAALDHGAEGEPPVVDAMASWRLSMDYEWLRARSESYAKEKGGLPKVYLVPTGPLGMRRARADFCWGFFGAGGFKVEEPHPFKDMDEAARAVLDSGTGVAVLCSDDESYSTAGPELVEKVKAKNKDVFVYIAGYPKDAIEQLEKAGVDGFVHIRSNAVETLRELQDRLDIGTGVSEHPYQAAGGSVKTTTSSQST